MRLSDEWIIEFEDYKRAEMAGNSNIYTSFNSSEISAIHNYFRWMTKKRFKNLCKNTSLIAKPKKAETLSNIMENATDWVYDGCVDQGRVGASHCELGHALRYEHYAYSPSLNKHIKFGVTCASDFFGIEQDKLRKINSIQAETLEEIKEIVFIRNTGKQTEYIKRYYNDFFNILKILGNDAISIIGENWLNQIQAFLKLNLPLTKSMINRLEYVRINYYKPKIKEIEGLKELKGYIGNDENSLKFIDEYMGLNIHFINLSMDYIKEYIKDYSEYREKCKRFVFKQAIKFRNLLVKLDKLNLSNKEFLDTIIKKAKQDIVYVRAKNGNRLATEYEAKEKGLNSYIKRVYTLDEHKYKLLNILDWCLNGNDNSYKESGADGLDCKNTLKIEKSAKLIKELMEWINDINFEMDILGIKNSKAIKYLDYAEDEDKGKFNLDILISDIQDLIYNQSSKDKLYDIALNIVCQYKTKGRISDKQIELLKQAYNKLKGLDTINDSIEDEPEIIKKSKYIISLSESKKLSSKYNVELAISHSILKYKRATEKQQYRIDKAYKELLEQSNKRISNRNNDILFLDEQVKNNIRYKDIEQQELFIEKQQNNGYNNIFANNKIPNICEISNALGKGYLKFKE